MATFHERIYTLYVELRNQDHKFGRAAFAKMLNVTLGQLNGWLNGIGNPDFEVLKRIAKNTGVSTNWLIGETENRTFTPISGNDLPIEAREEYEYLLAYLKSKYTGQKNK